MDDDEDDDEESELVQAEEHLSVEFIWFTIYKICLFLI